MNMLPIAIAVSLCLAVVFALYVGMLVQRFVHHSPDAEYDDTVHLHHFVIPALNEQSVIGQTVDYLLATFPDAQIWVVDDASTDATAEIVSERVSRTDRVRQLQRTLPHAKTGKGDALNHAYQHIAAVVAAEDRARTIITVVDADGRPSPNLFRVTAGPRMFGDPGVGAVQVEVRMINRDDRQPIPDGSRFANWFARTLIRLQDVEFRGPISAMQMLRGKTGTVNVGGNGQLTRLSALDSIAGRMGTPWGKALLEDYELGLRLMLKGWRNEYTIDAWVDQEAINLLPQLLLQRTRWAQGSMQCLPYLKRVWRSPHFTNIGVVEVSYYLFQPWMQVVGSIVYPIPMLVFLENINFYGGFVHDYMVDGGAAMLVFYLLVGMAEFVVWGALYRRCSERQVSLSRALGWGFALVAYNVLIYVIAWRAVLRVLGGQTEWPKTLRNDEALALRGEMDAQ